MPLKNGLSPTFLDDAQELLFLVREYGIDKAGSRPATAEQFLDFVVHVHDGWKRAQKRVAELLIDALVRRDRAKDDVKRKHRLKDIEGKRAASATLSQAKLEVRVLQRMLDAILWMLLSGDHSTLRRLFVKGGRQNLSEKNIADVMPTADDANKDPHVIAVCTDMLSLVHLGDLLIVNRKTGLIQFVELKRGDKNYAISKAAEFAIQSECEMFEALTTSTFDETDKKHYERAKRQSKRNTTILNAIRNQVGTDHNTGATVNIRELGQPVELWCSTITKCYAQLTWEKAWAIATVDECVHVGVYSNQEIAFVGFNSWMDRIKCESPIYNLTDSFFLPSSRPLGATFLSLELQTKMLSGEVLVIVCLDILRMIELGNKIKPGLIELSSKKETEKARGAQYGSLEFKGRLVRVNQEEDFVFLGAGIRDRIVFDQQRPFQILSTHASQGAL